MAQSASTIESSSREQWTAVDDYVNDLLTGSDAALDAALEAFQNRRWDRCRMVVENSGRLGEIEIAGGDKAEHASIMRDTLMSLAQDI